MRIHFFCITAISILLLQNTETFLSRVLYLNCMSLYRLRDDNSHTEFYRFKSQLILSISSIDTHVYTENGNREIQFRFYLHELLLAPSV